MIQGTLVLHRSRMRTTLQEDENISTWEKHMDQAVSCQRRKRYIRKAMEKWGHIAIMRETAVEEIGLR